MPRRVVKMDVRQGKMPYRRSDESLMRVKPSVVSLVRGRVRKVETKTRVVIRFKRSL